MYGRMMIRLSSQNSNAGDFTFIQAAGAPQSASMAPNGTSVMYRGRLDYRHDHFMANYETWVDANNDGITDWETDCWSHPDGIPQAPAAEYIMPKDEWACVQWHFDAENNALNFWLNGNELSQINVIETGDGCRGDVQNNVWWAPETFTSLRLGIEQYHSTSAARTMYIDDVAVDDEMVGCYGNPVPDNPGPSI